MARQCCIIVASSLLALCVGPTEAGFGDWLSNTASSVGSSVSSAASSAASHVSQSAEDLANKGKDLSGAALESVVQKACDLKAWEDVCSVNGTMNNQLKVDCETQAARSEYMHDSIFGSCITMGSFNINRTLEKQLPKMKADCVQMLHDAPGDIAGTLERWSDQSQKALTEKVGPGLQDAVDKAKEAVGAGGGDQQPEQKFMTGPQLVRKGVAAYASVPVLLALPLLASVASVVAWRRTRSMTTPEDEELLEWSSEDCI